MKTQALGQFIKKADQLDLARKGYQYNKDDDGYRPEPVIDPKVWGALREGSKAAWDTVQDVSRLPRMAGNAFVNFLSGYGPNVEYGPFGAVPYDSVMRLHDGLMSQPIVADALGRTIDTGLTRVGDRFRTTKIAPVVERQNALAHDRLRRDLYWNDDAYNYNKPAEDIEAQVQQLLLLRGAGKLGAAAGNTANSASLSSALGIGAPMAFETIYKSGLDPSISGKYSTYKFDDSELGWKPDPYSYVDAPIQNYTDLFDMYKFWSPMAAAGAGKVSSWLGNNKVGPFLENATSWIEPATHGNILGGVVADSSRMDAAKDTLARVQSKNDNPFHDRARRLSDNGNYWQAVREWNEQIDPKNPYSWVSVLNNEYEDARASRNTGLGLGAFFAALGLSPRQLPAYLIPAGVGTAAVAKPYVDKAWEDWKANHPSAGLDVEEDNTPAFNDPMRIYTSTVHNSVPDSVSM